MTISSDNFSLYAGAAFAGLACVWYLAAGAAAKHESRTGPRLCLAAAVSFTYASVYLLTQLLSGARYDIAYVFEFTGPADSLIYRFSALWAGQEGSLLIWLTICAWAGVIMAARRRRSGAFALGFWFLLVTLLGGMLLVTDPFAKLLQYRPGMVGLGLNPLLKNPWIAIHPPLVFFGYAALMIPAAFATGALVRGRFDDWAREALPWVVFGWACLGAGIALGMVWSYEVLGWGGYWAWDPVENASLVPWLVGTALVHSILLQIRTRAVRRTNLVLALAAFLTVLYAAFLTRSGVLSELSLHSFAEGGAYSYWLWTTAGFAALSVVLLAARWSNARAEPGTVRMRRGDLALLFGIIALSLFALVVLVGTSVPLVTRVVVKPEFFSRMALPLAVLIAAAIGIATLLRSGSRTTGVSLLRSGRHIAHAGVAVMLIGVVFSSGSTSRKLTLWKDGPSASAMGYSFAYEGRTSGGPNRETVLVAARRAGRSLAVPMTIEYTERGAVRTPYVRSGLFSDLYVSPIEIGGSQVTPTASVTRDGWISLPAQIPGADATLTLQGMQVEQEMAKLRYQPAKGEPVDFEAVKGRPVRVKELVVQVRRLLVNSPKDMSVVIAGADLVVSGGNVPERAVVEVSVKPLVSLVWLGAALITLGAGLAAIQRIRESFRGERWDTTQ